MSLLPYDAENPPAFPVMVKTPNGVFPEGGMTLRDWFAGRAVGLCVKQTKTIMTDTTAKEVAEDAYRIADAMMKARKPKTP